MTATGIDTRSVFARNREDAIDMALRRWADERWTVLTPREDIEARPVGPEPSILWRVTAEVAVTRREPA